MAATHISIDVRLRENVSASVLTSPLVFLLLGDILFFANAAISFMSH